MLGKQETFNEISKHMLVQGMALPNFDDNTFHPDVAATCKAIAEEDRPDAWAGELIDAAINYGLNYDNVLEVAGDFDTPVEAIGAVTADTHSED